jgi:branched-chain amino acid transport system substrate-binding protein
MDEGVRPVSKEERMKRLLGLTAALSVVLAASLTTAGAAPQRAGETGVTSKKIVLGGTFPLSGPVSSYAPIARGLQAYFSYVNARRNKGDGKRGVYGRQIVWKVYDDAYNPAQTVQLTNRLILQDKIFANVGSLGTEPNLPIRPLLNQRKVPHILVSTGASYWGLQYRQYPWTIGWQTDYISEGRIYGQWIRRNQPNARIAVFYQNDDYGKDYLNGLKQGLGNQTSRIASELSYEVTDSSYGSQISRQRASGATLWVLFTTAGTPTVRALGTARQLGWKPQQIVINSVAASDAVMRAAQATVGAEFLAGTVSTAYLKNPTNPNYANDQALKQYRRIVAKYLPGSDANNTFFLYGFAKAYDAVRLLYLAGKNPTRASLMRATQRMNWTNPYLIKGIKVKTSKRDRFPIDQVKLIRYNNGSWSEFGQLFDGRQG